MRLRRRALFPEAATTSARIRRPVRLWPSRNMSSETGWRSTVDAGPTTMSLARSLSEPFDDSSSGRASAWCHRIAPTMMSPDARRLTATSPPPAGPSTAADCTAEIEAPPFFQFVRLTAPEDNSVAVSALSVPKQSSACLSTAPAGLARGVEVRMEDVGEAVVEHRLLLQAERPLHRRDDDAAPYARRGPDEAALRRAGAVRRDAVLLPSQPGYPLQGFHWYVFGPFGPAVVAV